MSSIGSISSSTTTQSTHGTGRRRPDPAAMAEKLFAQLDTSGQGYIKQSDLEAAMSKVGSSTATSGSASDLFSKLDSNGDGKVTKDEFSSALQSAAQQLDSQFNQMRMQGGANGMPPPPPQNDSGFTKSELQQQLSEVGSTDSKRSALLNKIVQNFDKADTDGDGKVSFKEAMAYDKSSSGTSASTSSSSSASTVATTVASTATGTTAAVDDSSMRLMMQIMRLMQAYNLDRGDNSSLTAISASA